MIMRFFGDDSGATVGAVAHQSEASFSFLRYVRWSLYPSTFGQAIASAFGHLASAVTVYSKMSLILIEQQKYSEALHLLLQAETITQVYALATTHEIAELHTAFSNYHFATEQYEDSIRSSLKSAEIFGILGLIRDQANSLKMAVEACRITGDLENALFLQTQRSGLLEHLVEE